MPTYTCWSTVDTIPAEARQRIAQAITELHHDVAVAARFSVQVLFNDLAPASIYVAGQQAQAGHVWIRADIRAGRTGEQKHELLDRIGTEVARILAVPREEIWVYINDVPRENFTEYGRLGPQPGAEEHWFAALPAELRRRLEVLA